LPPDPELISAVLQAIVNDNEPLIWRDPAMEKVIRLAESVARSDASVLISGESGTGKEVIARLIHEKSQRSKKPFVSINCAAIPETLLESELFGHEKGAFTGASARRIGKFEEADGGTLLLDEISEMEFRLQAKLLRAIQERVIDRIGGSRPVPVNIRIIATSNRNMMDAVSKGQFREDLYFRLNVIGIQVPPLRERTQDILALASHFIEKFSEINGMREPKLTADAKRALLAAPWRGNVRELENVIHRAVLLSNGLDITPNSIRIDSMGDPRQVSDIAAKATRTAETATRQLIGQTVTEVERQLIFDTLDHCSGNRTQAAKILGISIRTLRNKLNQYVTQGFSVNESLT
jgi:DNA-binding NtrC family response regulator